MYDTYVSLLSDDDVDSDADLPDLYTSSVELRCVHGNVVFNSFNKLWKHFVQVINNCSECESLLCVCMSNMSVASVFLSVPATLVHCV